MRVGLAAAVVGGLGFAAFTQSQPPRASGSPATAAMAERDAAAAEQAASRSLDRSTSAPPAAATPSPTAKAPGPTVAAQVQPVAGLTQAQMENARAIVASGVKQKIPRFGLIVAIATAMQESNLYNVASEVLPESKNYPHQGTGWDHDSVGLFQQRTSTGWGAVRDLMQPTYAADQFFRALRKVPGWEMLSVTRAAQTVQGSAFPDAYAKHETRATTVVDALLV